MKTILNHKYSKKGVNLIVWICFGFLIVTSFIGNLFIIKDIDDYLLLENEVKYKAYFVSTILTLIFTIFLCVVLNELLKKYYNISISKHLNSC